MASSKYMVSFDGKTIETTVTDKGSEAHDWVEAILSATHQQEPVIVGLDIEWRPHQYSFMSNKTATVQLCIDDKCLILQMFYMDGIPQVLKDFLGDSRFKFVGIEVGNDVTKLKNEYGLECSSHADICLLAKERYPGRFRRPGLKQLAFELVGLRMLKPMHVTKSDWQTRVLSVEQIEYACIDAYASYKIGYKLIVEN